MIYLACPYSDPNVNIRNERFHLARQALFLLWRQNRPALCPIILGHEYEQRQKTGVEEKPHEFWMLMARTQLVACTQLWLLTIPGWSTSEGVREEVRLAQEVGRAVIPFAPFDKCDDISASELFATFGLRLERRLGPLQTLRTALQPLEE